MMQFFDEVKITIESGKGGDGLVTGRRESGVPYGGPSGGNGGHGGSVIFKASKDENTLLPYKYKKKFKAHYGEPGRSKDQYGANAEDLILPVPVGTLIRDTTTGNVLHIFSQDGETWRGVKGGEGGLGNIHFKDAVHQFPQFCLLGEPGDQKEIILELQLLADVGLIGTPSVGKSSLINTVSHAKAKVAEYPFTTLIPNLGSVEALGIHFNMIDIPGLIKGAADGKGLGNAFLRHILKARIFCMVADLARYENGIQEIVDLFEEIFAYIEQKFPGTTIDIIDDDSMITLKVFQDQECILEKRILFVFNKYDLINDEDIIKEYIGVFFNKLHEYFISKHIAKKIPKKLYEASTCVVSAATHYGIDKWLSKLAEFLKKTTVEEVYHIPTEIIHQEKISYPIISPLAQAEKELLIEQGYVDEVSSKYNEFRSIEDPTLCKLVWMTQWGNDEAEQRFWNHINQRGILKDFEDAGIHHGDVLKIKSFYEGKEDRYILYP